MVRPFLYVDYDLTLVEQTRKREKLYFEVETTLNNWDRLRSILRYNHDLVVFNLRVLILAGLEAIRQNHSEESLPKLPYLGFTFPLNTVM